MNLRTSTPIPRPPGRVLLFATVLLSCSLFGSVARAEAPPPEPAPLPWAGTNVTWGNELTVNTFAGSDYISSDLGRYVTSLAVSPGFFAFWHPRHQIRFSTRLALQLEVPVRDDGTGRSAEVDLADLPIELAYSAVVFSFGEGRYPGGPSVMRDPTLLGRGDHRLWIIPTVAAVFPTSRVSRAMGVYATPTLGVAVRLQLKLLGGDAPALQHLFITASERYAHTFAKSSTPEGPRGDTLSTGISGGDALMHAVSLVLPVYRGLELSTAFGLTQRFATGLSSNCVPVGGGCATVSPTTGKGIDSSAFDVSLGYLLIPELSLTIGYANTTPTLDLFSGKSRSVFHGPDALLHAELSLSIDRLYQRASRRP